MSGGYGMKILISNLSNIKDFDSMVIILNCFDRKFTT